MSVFLLNFCGGDFLFCQENGLKWNVSKKNLPVILIKLLFCRIILLDRLLDYFGF